MKLVQQLLCFSLVLAVSASTFADDADKKGKKKKGRKKPTATQRFVAKLDLTDEQKTQVSEIDKKFAEPFAANQKKMADILTAEQKEAQKAAQKAAKEAGTKGAEARKAVAAALNLTDAQKASQKELMVARRKMDGEIIAALKKVLTEEQQETLPQPRKRGGKKEGKKKKADKA
ncbi:MAG: hypothetical protein ABJZ55_02675 [Fuerstiella sp.]